MIADRTAADASWPLGRLLVWTTEFLSRHHVEESRLATEVLLAHAVGCRRIDLYARFDQVPDTKCLDRFRRLVRSAAAHEPIAYLVGEKEFFSLSFAVTPDVLIPRPETETLVEVVIDHCLSSGRSQPFLLDLGTGSGCIVIALLKNLPEATAAATDVSPAALKLARQNAERHGVLDRLRLVEGDCLSVFDGAVNADAVDAVFSNPPYVPSAEVPTLAATVRDHEPLIALTDGCDGLSFYRRIAAEGPRLMAADGVVIVEVGDGRAPVVRRVFEDSGRFAHRKTVKDRVAGKDRVLVFSRSRR